MSFILYLTEKFVNQVSFSIGFMLSLIFLSASMSILYFYLQTSLAGEREKYLGLRKLGLSIKEIRTVVTKELLILIFVPFLSATMLEVFVLFSLLNNISPVFFQMSALGAVIFAILFALGFLIIRRVYVAKLVN